LYHDIVGQCIAILRYRTGARQAGNGPAQRQDEDTGIDDSCCQHRPVSAGDNYECLSRAVGLAEV